MGPSPSWSRFTGQPPEIFMNGKGWDAIHPDDLGFVSEVWSGALRERRSFTCDYRLRRHDGVFVPMQVRGTPVFAEDGSVREWIGTTSDVTERKRTESQLRFLAKASVLLEQSLGPAETMSAIVALAVPDFADACTLEIATGEGVATEQVAVAHRDPAKVALLREFRRKYPVDPAEPYGTGEVLRSGKSEFFPDIPEPLIDQTSRGPDYARLLREIGLRSAITVPMTAGGERLGTISFVRVERRYHLTDVTTAEEVGRRAAIAVQTSRLFDEAQRARREAEAASRAKDEFLAMLGHELRNPLAPIVTALQLLRLRGDLKNGREQAILDRQVKHLVRLVDDLLDIARVTRGLVELKRETLQLSAVVARGVEMASPLLEQRRHLFSSEVPEGLWLDGDETRIAQVFGNLLNNAAKYTPPGGIVSIRADRDGDELVVRVRDNGNGIRPDLLPQVFDLFVQGDRSIERGEGGLGIGLTLVRTFVSMHGGTVKAFSEGAGKGSEFVVRLPALREATAQELPSPLRAAPAGKGLRVLLVDDNEDAAQMLGEVLTAGGHQVRVAHDAPGALLAARGFVPEVAVLDIGLPVMDGYELARRLRGEQGEIRLIAVTGYGQESDRERGRAAGFEAHLIKPVDVGRLLAALDGSTAS